MDARADLFPAVFGVAGDAGFAPTANRHTEGPAAMLCIPSVCEKLAGELWLFGSHPLAYLGSGGTIFLHALEQSDKSFQLWPVALVYSGSLTQVKGNPAIDLKSAGCLHSQIC